MGRKAQRGVRPKEVELALHRFFAKFLIRAEKERRRRGIGRELHAAQIVFWPGLETSVRLDDEVALQLRFTDGAETPLLIADPLAYFRARKTSIAWVTADEGSLGHITALLGQWIEPRLAPEPLVLSDKPLRARAIMAWDLRGMLAEAIGIVAARRTALLDPEKDTKKERRRRKKQLGGGIVMPDSKNGRELFELLRPKRPGSYVYRRLGVNRDEWLAGELAAIIVDGSFAAKGAALLPAHYLFVEDQGFVLWEGWLGDKRSAVDLIQEMVRGKLEAEAFGRGIGSRRSKRDVITESDLPDSLDDLSDLGAEALIDGVVERLLLEWAVEQLTPSERRAWIVAQDADREGISVEEACRRRRWKSAPIRKAMERARKHLKEILGYSPQTPPAMSQPPSSAAL